jgi:hypothetical protein
VTDRPPAFFGLDVAAEQHWMMQMGERFAFEGLLSQIRPRVAVEVGTWEGGSLRRIAAHSETVHAFDIDEIARSHADALDNVTLHLGDSAQTLPQVLAELNAAGEQVDFVLVDGLHSYDAVTVDARSLLESGACRSTVVVFHDAAHTEVRRALEDLDLRAHPKVSLSLLDFVPGYLVRDAPDLPAEIRGRGFNGLALVVLDAERGTAPTGGHEEFVSVPELHRSHAERTAAPGPADPVPARRRQARWKRRPDTGETDSSIAPASASASAAACSASRAARRSGVIAVSSSFSASHRAASAAARSSTTTFLPDA